MRGWRKKFLLGALLVLVLGAAAEWGCLSGWLEGPENFYYDIFHHAAGNRYKPQNVVIVAIDDQTRLEHQDEPLVFWSPYFARVIQVLRQAGARAVGLDYLFSVSAESWLKKLKLPESQTSRTYDLAFREQLAGGQVVLAGDLFIDPQGKARVLLPIADYWSSLPGKLDDVGLVNFYNDPDGAIRCFVWSLPDDEGELWLTFARLLSERAAPGSLGAEALPTPRRIGFAGPPGAFPRIPLRRLLSPGAEADPMVQGVKGKVVIVAYEPSELRDIHMTPYARSFLQFRSAMMSGPELHANIVETLLTGRFPRPVPAAWRLIFLLVMLAFGTAWFFRLSPWRGLAMGGLLSLGAVGVVYLLFLRGWILPLAGLQLSLALTYLGALGLRLTGEERERARLRQIFGRYVSEEVVEKLVESGKQPDLGGEACQVTILFSDIRNFTTLSESLRPQEVVEMLNAYFSQACQPILEQGGSVDKFIGDAVMAVFGSPAPHPDHARRAITAALALAAQARDFRTWMAERFADLALPLFNIGIGLHTGEAVVGNIGSPQRLEFTSIGDTVNTASRLEGLTKELGWTIVASRETITAAGPGVVTGREEQHRVKGRQEPVTVLEVLGLESGVGEANPGREPEAGKE